MIKTSKNFLMPFGGNIKTETLSGLTVALALVPEAIAFSLVAQVDPHIGLYAAAIVCLITALFGGRPGMISGATGSMAIVYVSIVAQYGVNYLFATIILTGIFQILVGAFRLGKLIRILPKSVMIGFVNGLAIVILLSQLEQFKIGTGPAAHWLSGTSLYIMVAFVAVAMFITHYLPKVTKALPGALAAIIVITVVVHFFGFHTRTVADMMGSSGGTNTASQWLAWLTVPLNWESLEVIVPAAAILTVIGLSESLMTLSLIDEMTNTRGRANKECIAQGSANVVSGFFNTMGGCAMLGQSMININSGGRGRLGGIVAAVALFIFIIALWGLIALIPLAALVGVMFMVVIETFEWTSFKLIRKIPRHDAFVIVVVTIVTVMTDLAVAVITGVIIAALVFAWETAKNIYAEKFYNTDQTEKTYRIHNPLFFGSVAPFKALFDFEKDPYDVVIDFLHSRVADHSAIDAIQLVAENMPHKANASICAT